MDQDVKDQLFICLDLIKVCMRTNGIAIAVDKESKNIIFFDEKVYKETGMMNGFTTPLPDSVYQEKRNER